MKLVTILTFTIFILFMVVQYYFGLGTMLTVAACLSLGALTFLYIGVRGHAVFNKKVPVPARNSSRNGRLR